MYSFAQAFNYILVRCVDVRPADTSNPTQFTDGDPGTWVVSAKQDQGGIHTLAD